MNPNTYEIAISSLANYNTNYVSDDEDFVLVGDIEVYSINEE